MDIMDKFRDNPRLLFAAVAAICLTALGAALASQYWGGLQPCVLCIYQRYAYGVALAFGLLGLLVGARAPWTLWLGIGAGLAFLGGAAIAAFHVGVEQKWWRGTDECHAPPLDASLSIDAQLDQLLNQPFVSCDQVAWSLFGISMAGYNVLASLVFAGFCFWVLARMRGEPAP